MRTSTLALAWVVAAVYTPSQLALGAEGPTVGRRHPDFVLPRIDDGKPVSLSDFRGKKVLLIQFASW